ncbi:MAG: MFS transporter [Chloroflexota bacterium]|nr:MFS transporter [Chloroflexota bacterium]
MSMHVGLIYSYGVFFKHLIADFGWSRAATSSVHSLFMISHGGFAIPVGWLADRFGPARVMATCAFIAGVGLALTSQVNTLWQFYVTYGLIFGIGESAGFTTTTSTTARWFIKRRGLALGIVASGAGLGTLIIAPVSERLITTFGWSTAYLVLAAATWAIMIPSALMLRRDPAEKGLRPYGKDEVITAVDNERQKEVTAGEKGIALKAAARYKPLWMLFIVYFLINFCLQMVMVHLVNYATDIGIASLIAATFISIVGIGSFVGRLLMGAASDRIGAYNALLVCCIIMLSTLAFLIFTRELWMFYLFAIVFGFAYGGEVPQMPVLVGRFFGLRAVATLVGVIVFGATSGGALGAWVGGQIFDVTQSYQLAFTIAAVTSFIAIVLTLILKKVRPVIQR